jgi:hypothetical protein
MKAPPSRDRSKLLVIVALHVANPLFDTVKIPLPLIPENGAQQRIDLAEGVQQIASQLPLLPDFGNLPGQLDHIAEDRPV